jgi:hypothetical protein
MTPYHLSLSLPSGLFPSGFLTNILYALLLSPLSAARLARFILFDLITGIIFGKGYSSLSSSKDPYTITDPTLLDTLSIYMTKSRS